MPEHILELQLVALDVLLAAQHPRNPKAHDLGAIEASITRYGMRVPVGLAGDRLAFGEGRTEALRRMRERGLPPPPGVERNDDGDWLVPTVTGAELTEDELLAFLVADNRTSELGGWQAGLLDVLAELRATPAGLRAAGFTIADQEDLAAQLGRASRGTGSPPARDPRPELPAVERGQLWRLREHVLICGDATDPPTLERLVGGRRIDSAFLDPPFNVAVGAHGGAAARGHRPMANDRLSAHEWEEFTRCWIANLLPRVEGALYIVMAHQQWPLLCRLLDEAGAVWSDSIVWRKDHFALGRGDYQRMFELIWYGWRRGARHHWSGARNEPDVWEIPRINVARDHPTEKPVALVERALRNSTPREGTVLDCFLGSGTTLMACERLGLTCLGLELEPQYLATAIQRWQDETGLEAELEDSGD